MDNDIEIKNYIKELITDEYIKNHSDIIQSMIKSDESGSILCRKIICKACFFIRNCGQVTNRFNIAFYDDFQSIIISALTERLKEYEKLSLT